MKNFKKVIAFLMVAAMTLGMGLTAFAEEEKVDAFEVKTELDGDVLKVSLVTKEQINLAGAVINMFIDDTKAVADKETVKTVAADYGYYDAEFDSWGEVGKIGAVIGICVVNYVDDADGKYLTVLPAALEPAKSKVAAGTTVFEFVISLTEAKAGDQVANIVFADISKYVGTTQTKITVDDIPVIVPEADDPGPGPDDSSSSDSSSDDVSKPSDSSNNSSSDDASKPSGSGDASKPGDTTAAGDNKGNTTAAGNNNANAPATTKSIATKDDALNSLDTLSKALAVKLDKNSFANDADYQAYVKALADAKNAKSDAEKATALKALKDAMSKAKDDVLVAAVKTVVNTTTAANKADNAKNTKTGDTAPIAVLMVVAIAAFGTAVVVYRKKVNA